MYGEIPIYSVQLNHFKVWHGTCLIVCTVNGSKPKPISSPTVSGFRSSCLENRNRDSPSRLLFLCAAASPYLRCLLKDDRGGNQLFWKRTRSMSHTEPENPRQPIKGELVDETSSNPYPSSTIMNVIIAILCAMYLINPTMGVIEFIPDNFPIIGNLDEATATAGLLYALSQLRVIPWARTK